ncbi:rhomboid family intramembrane serine protease [Streptomyces sp. WAC05374]|uniref:rhomboid family intramembrane serine protease n=1 Tax=Streptomyces sp. WAC05374 TaxID=2487420 RepID=UPI000F871761|nr:rhomboid family intramembrane serine protease [Streptomyces sp. WAC05374]RST18237.1 rhomboid family intramembrane serine protease [Streptomyces sp. WAC05374]TDF40434.1 rhomboid family intramembrane serine protease [Streptomyces sp. WAC05374]TDF49068.1 rhomboid family intramembrane serine protease [Streptomyces sp. WAC05374]TDF49554.1 rhomboid family intramembrane serine protease [Streptomyces sp. WAC05374]
MAGTTRAGTAGRTGADRVKAAAALMLAWVALLWLLEAVDLASGHALDAYGVSPREVVELRDVVPAAFLHFGFGHVAANTVPLLVFGFLAALGGIRRFLGVAALIVVADGLGVWLVAPPYSVTAGASGLIFGLFGYLLVRGFVDRKPMDIVVGLLIGAIWGSTILLGISPTQSGVSWQGHLFGLLAGVAAAFVFRRRRPRGAPGLTP